jgi:hypothetical protein
VKLLGKCPHIYILPHDSVAFRHVGRYVRDQDYCLQLSPEYCLLRLLVIPFTSSSLALLSSIYSPIFAAPSTTPTMLYRFEKNVNQSPRTFCSLSGKSCHSGLQSSALREDFARAREASWPAKTRRRSGSRDERCTDDVDYYYLCSRLLCMLYCL